MKQKLLSKAQRVMMTQIAMRGWRKMTKAGAIDESFNDWRLRESMAACGFRISEAPASAFDDLFSHFKALEGDVTKAFGIATGPSNEVRQWINNMEEELARDGLTLAFTKPIAFRKWGTEDLTKLSMHQLRAISYDVDRAVKARIQKRELWPDWRWRHEQLFLRQAKGERQLPRLPFMLAPGTAGAAQTRLDSLPPGARQRRPRRRCARVSASDP